jgi:DNA-binding CsgD family transcriptional regulator
VVIGCLRFCCPRGAPHAADRSVFDRGSRGRGSGLREAERPGAARTLATAGFAVMLTAADLQELLAAPGAGQLSRRERELVTVVAQGRTDAQMAGLLFIIIRTVRCHLDRIRDKTRCRRRADLIRLVLQVGLV